MPHQKSFESAHGRGEEAQKLDLPVAKHGYLIGSIRETMLTTGVQARFWTQRGTGTVFLESSDNQGVHGVSAIEMRIGNLGLIEIVQPLW